MNDLSNILSKFMPVVVIGSLFGLFYLLDVFSVRPGMDTVMSAPVRTTAEQVSVPVPKVAVPVAAEAPPNELTPPATAVIAPIPASVPQDQMPVPSLPDVAQSAVTTPPPPVRVMNSTRHFMPPPGVGLPRPLASGRPPSEAPVELQTHEIIQDNGEPIDSPAPNALEQLEPPSPGGGGDG